MNDIKSYIYKPLFWLAAIVALSVIGLLITMALFYRTASSSFTVYVYPDSTSESVRDSMAVKSGNAFASSTMFMVNLMCGNVHDRVGAYGIDSGTSSFEAARKIARRMQTPIKFTFNNVRTIEELAKRVDSRFMMNDKDFLKVVSDSAVSPTEFLPDTYEFFWTVTPTKMIKTLCRYHDRWWNDSRKEKAAKLNLTAEQVSILASIVEEETTKSEEKGMVARLYLNRLEKGMLLQADPTVKFAIGDFSLRRISGDMLKTDSPYNTYRYAGLPPGPIRIPEKSTIDAVLDAPMHPYLYMCAKPDFSGRHIFTASYSEHQRNARNYQAALNARGIAK